MWILIELVLAEPYSDWKVGALLLCSVANFGISAFFVPFYCFLPLRCLELNGPDRVLQELNKFISLEIHEG